MKPHSTYQPIEANVPFRGFASSFPATKIPPNFASDLLNVTVRNGVVKRRPGYNKIGQTLDGIVLDIVEFAQVGATPRLIVFTSLAQYWYDPTPTTGNKFIDISVETPWTYNISLAPTPTTFTVAENLTTVSNHLDVGTKICVSGSTANDGTYTVVTAAGSPTVITVSEPVPDTTIDGSIIVTRREDIGSATQATKTLVITGIDLTSYISVGDTIYIKDSTANDGTYTVDTIVFGADTTIVVIETLPDAADTADGYITHRADRGYSDGDILNTEDVTDINSRRLLHTNGVDPPIQWFGDTTDIDGHFMRWRPLLANFVTCSTFRVFKESLFMGGVEAVDSEPSLIAWSDSGDFEDFTNGNSGSQILYELPTGIKQLVTLGDRIIIYSRDAVVSGIFVGTPFFFAFETVIPAGTRLASPKGIASINVGHIYAAEENFYIFDGSRGLRTLADIIRTDYKALKDQQLIHQIAILNDFSKSTIYTAVPTVDDLGVVYTLEYDVFNLAQRAWSKETYANHPRAFGFFTNAFTYTWEDSDAEVVLAAALGNASGFLFWGDESGTWANEGEQPDFPVRVFGDASGNVYASAENVISDNGTNQPGYYITGDFTVPEEFLSAYGRWGEIEFEAKGDSVTVSSLKDHGGAVATTEVVTLDAATKSYRIPIDVTSRTLRVRFDFTGAFELRWVKCWVKPTSVRD